MASEFVNGYSKDVAAGSAARSGTDTSWISERARSLGFDLCGVVQAEKFPELGRTSDWLQRGFAGEMHYLLDERRSDPRTAMVGVRSVIVCAMNYNSPAPRSTEIRKSEDQIPRGWISRYAWGDDYHQVLAQRLRGMAGALSERFSEPFEARIYSDTGPVNERVLAKYAGLGWIGKNTLLLNAKLGSWFFLGVILTTLELSPTLATAEMPPPDLCGSCTKCLDACPTDAFVEPYVMDARRCIAYLTIELRSSIPEALREPMGHHIFGCDICQDVCPWNRRAPVSSAPEFQPRRFSGARDTGVSAASILDADSEVTPAPTEKGAAADGLDDDSLFSPRLEWLASLTEEQFRSYFRGSPIKRAKWRGLVRNACIALGNSSFNSGSPEHTRIVQLLRQLSASSEPVISESAHWALSRIQ